MNERADPTTIARSANVGFYMGADAQGAAAGGRLFRGHFGSDPRAGFLRGTPDQVVDLVGAYRESGCQRLNIGLRQGPYDWEALLAYAEEVLPQFGVRRSE